MKEYKIIEIWPSGLGEKCEDLLNEMAAQGWSFKIIYSGVGSMVAQVIFERDKNI